MHASQLADSPELLYGVGDSYFVRSNGFIPSKVHAVIFRPTIFSFQPVRPPHDAPASKRVSHEILVLVNLSRCAARSPSLVEHLTIPTSHIPLEAQHSRLCKEAFN